MNKIKLWLFGAAFALPLQAVAACETYFDVGVGWKFQETVIYNSNTGKPLKKSPTADLNLGAECGKHTVELFHRSQWLLGKPFNDEEEYSVTGLQYKYRFSLGKW